MIFKPTILVADDDAGVRSVMATRLIQAGFVVQTAESGAAALASIKRLHLDAALLDVKMPDIDGFAVCEQIRRTQACRDIPVFMLTGADDGIIRNHLGTLTTTAGGNHYVTKPCDGKALAAEILRAVYSKGPRSPT